MERTDSAAKSKRERVDGQVTGLAGELFVAAELLKRGLQTSITFGNAKAIDLLAYHPTTEKSFTVQVKTVRKRTAFPISPARVQEKHVYVFVILNKPGVAVQYFIVPGAVLVNEPARFTNGSLPKISRHPACGAGTIRERLGAIQWVGALTTPARPLASASVRQVVGQT
jgi:hypothetical protein